MKNIVILIEDSTSLLQFYYSGKNHVFLNIWTDHNTYKLLPFFVVSSKILFKLLEETSHPSFTNFEIMSFYHPKNRRDFETCQKLSYFFQNTKHFDLFYANTNIFWSIRWCILFPFSLSEFLSWRKKFPDKQRNFHFLNINFYEPCPDVVWLSLERLEVESRLFRFYQK